MTLKFVNVTYVNGKLTSNSTSILVLATSGRRIYRTAVIKRLHDYSIRCCRASKFQFSLDVSDVNDGSSTSVHRRCVGSENAFLIVYTKMCAVQHIHRYWYSDVTRLAIEDIEDLTIFVTPTLRK